MSEPYDTDLDDAPDERSVYDSAKDQHSLGGCLAVVVAAAVLVGGAIFVVTKSTDALSGLFSSTSDFEGDGTGSVTVEVAPGAGAVVIGEALTAAGVVASVEAFTAAAEENPDARLIQPGTYELRNQMSGEAAVELLLDPESRVFETVTVREGLRLRAALDDIAAATGFDRQELQDLVDGGADLGLPSYAEGNAEGFLFPATYEVAPTTTPEQLLRAMVERFNQATAAVDLEGRAEDVGLTPYEVVIVASMLEGEVNRVEDMPLVAQVIYNRLEEGEVLGFDSTVHYAVCIDDPEAEGCNTGSVFTSSDDRDVDSPYNTYDNQGLPPGPISSPGEAALNAALSPAGGDVFYFVTVDLETGETRFAETANEHEANRDLLAEWCSTHEHSGCS